MIMKKVFIISVFCFVTALVAAQEVFTVPELTVDQKYARMVGQTRASYLGWISYAKSLGKSVEEASVYSANLFKTSWNKEAGYEGFVKGMLYNWVCFVPNNEIVILEQNSSMIKFRSKNMYPGFRKAGESLGVTYDELILSWNIVGRIIGEYLGASYTQEVTDEGTFITITRK